MIRMVQIGGALAICAFVSLVALGLWGAVFGVDQPATAEATRWGRVVDYTYRQIGTGDRQLILKVDLEDGTTVEVPSVPGIGPDIGNIVELLVGTGPAGRPTHALVPFE